MYIALATAAFLPDLASDDQVLAAVLAERGVRCDAVVWEADVDWRVYDLVIVRSIWDYHLKYPRYLEWLETLDRDGVRVFNATSLQRWNATKTYLLELEARGVSIVPTVLNPPGLSHVHDRMGWNDLVIKPVVGASGYEAWTCSAPFTAETERRFAAQLAVRPMLVQRFVPHVQEGERSYVFINGEYSHAVMKRAAPGEFRVHIEHGGSVEAHTASEREIEWARRAVRAAPSSDWLFARVDALDTGDELLLMELELLDPELFFSHNVAAAHAIIDRITRIPS